MSGFFWPHATIASRLKAGLHNPEAAVRSTLRTCLCLGLVWMFLPAVTQACSPVPWEPEPIGVLLGALSPDGTAAGGGQPAPASASHPAPAPAQDAWSIQRRMESLGVDTFSTTAEIWIQEMGDPARRAVLLCAGATPTPGLTISGRERRDLLSERALAIVAKGLADADQAEAWRNLLFGALAAGDFPAATAGSSLAVQGAQAAINVIAGLQLTQFSDAVAGYMLPEGSPAMAESAQEHCAFLLHDQAQLCLFRMYGVWFSSREEFEEFPLPGEEQAVHFREVFAKGAARESRLALQLLDARAESGVALLKHPDPNLRAKAVERLIRAVGEQALTPSSVRKTLSEAVLRESSPEVSDAMLQGLLDLALAEGAESPAAQELRTTLQACARNAPIALVPSLLSAFDRLPRPNGEAGQEVALEDGASACQLFESLWSPHLRLDRDTTLLALRAWSRVQTKLNAFGLSEEPQRRAGTLVLDLMADPYESERVRLVSAEALAGWPLDVASMQRVLDTLAAPESSASLRRATYPLVLAGVARLDWNSLAGETLIQCLLRDMGHGDLDLRRKAIQVASQPLLVHHFSDREVEQGTLLPALMALVEAEASPAARSGLLDLIRAIANTTPRPDLLAEHLRRPVAKAWIHSEEVELVPLAATYEALAGPGHGDMLAEAAMLWVRESSGTPNAVGVLESALEMALSMETADAKGLPLETHRALYDMALEFLLKAPREAGLSWSRAHGDRMLTVHIAALDAANEFQEQGVQEHATAYLEAKLLAAAVTEDDGAVRTAFNKALAQSQGNPLQRILVLRDRARFFESFGKEDQAKAEWVRLVQWMAQQQSGEGGADLFSDLDYQDLGNMTAAAERAKLQSLACGLWQLRTMDPVWKLESPAVRFQEIVQWSEAAILTQEPGLLQEWLAKVELEVQAGQLSENGSWLTEVQQAQLGERSTRMRALIADQVRDSETEAIPEGNAVRDQNARESQSDEGVAPEGSAPPKSEKDTGELPGPSESTPSPPQQRF